MHRNLLFATACAGLLVQGCSSRPREFSPTLYKAPADQAAFDSAHATCNQLLADGKLDSSGRLASAGAGAAAGAGVAAVGAAAASSAGIVGGMAVASATVILLPFAAIGGAVGLAKMKRAKKEKAIQMAMAGCLHERGYDVADWEKAKKNRSTSTTTAAN